MKRQQEKSWNAAIAALSASLFLAGAANGAILAPPGPEQGIAIADVQQEAQEAGLLWEELLTLAGLADSLVVGPVAMNRLLEAAKLDPSARPSAMVQRGREILQHLGSAQTSSEAFVAAAGIGGLAPTPNEAVSAPLSLDLEILNLYARMGAPTGPLVASQLAVSAAHLGEKLAWSLSDVVQAVNEAYDAAITGDTAVMVQATANLLATIEKFRGKLEQRYEAHESDCILPPEFEDPEQFIILGGTCDDEYNASVNRVIQIDLGGNDTYLNNAGGADSANPAVTTDLDEAREHMLVAISVDLSVDLHSGFDTYSSARVSTQGAAPNGIGILFDDGGNDGYTATAGSGQGQGSLQGIGVLVDLAGDDTYNAGQLAQGSESGGYLLDLGEGGNDTYSAGTGSQGGQAVPFPAGSLPPVLFDAGGSDTYTVLGIGQGVGGYLIDVSGNDTYAATGSPRQDFLDGWAQGVGFVVNDGFLIDGGGNDYYTSDIAVSQGYAAGDASGALLDFGGGNDVYNATHTAQAVCQTIAGGQTGVLYDNGGNDTYTTGDGQGSSRGPCGAFLIDGGGDDIYAAGPNSQGAAVGAQAGVPVRLGLLLDSGGNDTYTAGAHSQGSGQIGAGILIDGGGTNHYSTQSASSTTNDVSTSSPIVVITGDNPHCGSSGPGGNHGLGAGFGGDACTTTTMTTTTYTNTTGWSYGEFSQGSGSDGGVGILVNGIGGENSLNGNSFAAGAHSQGGGSNAGLGLLVDNGVSSFDALGAASTTTITAVTTSTTITGPIKNLSTTTTTTTSTSTTSSNSRADFSQGSGQNAGIGVLLNEGGTNDEYRAGSGSQGAAVNGSIGILVDLAGDDDYNVPNDSATSQGNAFSTPENLAIGLLLDGNGTDAYSSGTGDGECREEGSTGLTIDAELPIVPSGCEDAIGQAAGALEGAAQAIAEKRRDDAIAQATQAADTVLGTVDDVIQAVNNLLNGATGPSPCVSPPPGEVQYFCEDMEGLCDPPNGTVSQAPCDGWTVGAPVASTPSQWHLVNQSMLTQPVGPNAHSGLNYWYSGLLGVPGLGYTSLLNTKLTSPAIDLTAVTGSIVLNVSLAGTSEKDFDFLNVYVLNESFASNPTLGTNVLGSFSESRAPLLNTLDSGDFHDDTPTTAPKYFQFQASLPAGFGAGHTVKMQFHFISDTNLEDGQGWNVDDVVVKAG